MWMPGLAQLPQHGLDLGGRHDEVAVDDGVRVPAGERGPGGQAHRAAHLDAVHHPVAADRDLDHPVLDLGFVTEDILDVLGSNLVRFRPDMLERDSRDRVRGTDILDRIPDALDPSGQLRRISLSADVHEVDLRLVIEEVVVQPGHLQTVSEGRVHGGVTSSWKTTVSPITIAPCGALVKPAHEPRPANGFSGLPSTRMGTSVRAQAMRTTPSGVVVALVCAALAIASASGLFSAPASAIRRSRSRARARAARPSAR